MNNYATQYIGKEIKVVIDRPLHTKHPKHSFIYELNYGYVPDTTAPDGEEVDAYDDEIYLLSGAYHEKGDEYYQNTVDVISTVILTN